MGQIIKSLDTKWTFEHFTNSKEVDITEPSILLTVEPFEEGNNSKFPFKITYGYFIDNPKSAFNGSLPFRLFDKEEILIVKKEYTDNRETNLIKDLKELKTFYNIEIFGLKVEL